MAKQTKTKPAAKKPTAAVTNGTSKAAAGKAAAKPANGGGKQDAAQKAPANLDPKVIEQIVQMRSKVHETFGKVALAMMALPRYRNQSIGDLSHMLLDPMVRDRVAIAATKSSEVKGLEDLSGIAIWASVSEEVDAKIREQIKTGTFPVRLKSDEWGSGEINWLLDVIAPNQKLATSVIANFKQVVKQGDVRIHPVVSKLVDPEILKKMGAAPIKPDEKPKT